MHCIWLSKDYVILVVIYDALNFKIIKKRKNKHYVDYYPSPRTTIDRLETSIVTSKVTSIV